MVNFEEIFKTFIHHSVILDKESVLKAMEYCFELGKKTCEEKNQENSM